MRKHVKEQLSGKWRTGAVSKALHHRNKRMQPIASSQQENATNRVTVFNCSSVERKYVFIIHEPALFTN